MKQIAPFYAAILLLMSGLLTGCGNDDDSGDSYGTTNPTEGNLPYYMGFVAQGDSSSYMVFIHSGDYYTVLPETELTFDGQFIMLSHNASIATSIISAAEGSQHNGTLRLGDQSFDFSVVIPYALSSISISSDWDAPEFQWTLPANNPYQAIEVKWYDQGDQVSFRQLSSSARAYQFSYHQNARRYRVYEMDTKIYGNQLMVYSEYVYEFVPPWKSNSPGLRLVTPEIGTLPDDL